MTSTNWSGVTGPSTGYLPTQTDSIYDGTGTYDGADLAASDPDKTYDGIFGVPPFSTTWQSVTGNSTNWS